ncbi:MAG: FUSC family protein, partial [Comamonas sp.]
MSTGAVLTGGWQGLVTRWGFRAPVLVFALRTAVAAFAALALAHALGLEHPHWAAMSAWASSQPTREHLLARGAYRFGGSVVGVVYAVALVLVAQDSLWVLALGLALWVGLCAFWGNLQRGYLVYGSMLAGYSAAMVVLLHHGPAQSIWPFAFDRLLTVITGVLAALAISWCFAPRRQAAVLIANSRSALAGVLQATALHLRQLPRPAALQNPTLLQRLAEVEELLELYPEGSRTARRTATQMRWQQHQAMELVYHLSQADRMGAADSVLHSGAQSARLAQALQTLAEALRAEPTLPDAHQRLAKTVRQTIAVCEDWVAALPAQLAVPAGVNAVYVLLQEIQRGLSVEQRDLGQVDVQPVELARRAPIGLHRDWIGARHAALRAGGSLLVFGLLWAWTESSVVAFGMLGLSVMLLVFSAFESPGRTMAFVLRGQIIGAALAVACQLLVWPWATSSWGMVWMLLPFALMGGLVFAHQRMAAGAMDTNMAMFILLAPVYPDTLGWGQHLSMALAVVSGPALAWLVYRWVYPTDGRRRMHHVARMML